MIRRVRAWWRELNSRPVSHCRCWDYDGGPYGYNAHECARGCPEHGPCGCESRNQS